MSGVDVLHRQPPAAGRAPKRRRESTPERVQAAGRGPARPVVVPPPAPETGQAVPRTPEVGCPPPGSPEDIDLTARANALALAYQEGRPEALPELVIILQPLLRTLLHRYLRGHATLPSTLDVEDLHQQGWVILEGLARRWAPAGGAFPAYVRTTFPWEVWRYVRAHSPTKRARAVRVDNVQHDLLMLRLADQTGVDGRRWDEQLIAIELLNTLDPIARWVFLLHVLEDRPFQDVAARLRLTILGAHRAYRRALDQLRLRAGLEVVPDDVGAGESGATPAVERLVAVLHEGMAQYGRLPGRAVVCARAGLSEVRFARLMGLLAQRGCIVGRSARRPGRLAHTTAAETLAQLRRAEPLP